MLIRPVTMRACAVLHGGGVIGYPTEGVYGIGCLPERSDALLRILRLKQRRARQGFILLAADRSQLEGWVDHEALDTIPEPASGDRPVTWVAPAGHRAHRLLTGGRRTVAVRISRHPVASALARNAESAIVSTSANRSGRDPARSMIAMRRWFADDLDFIVPGPLGTLEGPTEIRIAGSGDIIRGGD